MDHSLFTELSTIVVVTFFIVLITRFLQLPTIIAYILAGISLSPYGFDLIQSHDTIEAFSQFGIALLLFMVGLNMNPESVRSVGGISLITGVGQVVFTSVIGFLIGAALGFGVLESVYIAIGLTFSSTIVIMKLLSDKGDTETLYGKISIGFLVVQDIIAMFLLLIVASFSTGENIYTDLGFALLKVIGAIAITLAMSRYILPGFLKQFDKNTEMLMIFSISWCLLFASVLHHIGLNLEIGALLAGVSLASSRYRPQITDMIHPLRDFFLLMFFVYLGSEMNFDGFSEFIIPTILFSLFILIGNPLIVVILMKWYGYSVRDGFLAGLTVAQISEFSLIFVALGVSVGHVDEKILAFVTLVGLITISLSSYMIMKGDQIYSLVARLIHERLPHHAHHFPLSSSFSLVGDLLDSPSIEKSKS